MGFGVRMLDTLRLIGTGLLALIFFANAVGIVPPNRAYKDLSRLGLPENLVHLSVWGGRALQMACVPLLFLPSTKIWAALALTGFLVGATYAAHPFWSEKDPERRETHVINFFKNTAMIGGLLVVGSL